MAKDIEVNGNIIDDQSTDWQEHNGDTERPSEGTMETRTVIYIDGQYSGQADEPLVNKVETTSAEDGLIETTEIKLKTASGCGHVLHTGSEAGDACLSCRRLNQEPLIFCNECAKNPDNLCYVCNSICCWKCRDERRVDGEMRVVCKACIRSTLRLKLLKQIIKWLFIAAALYYLVMF